MAADEQKALASWSIKPLLNAGYPAILVNTREEHRAIKYIQRELEHYKGYSVFVWDIVSGEVEADSKKKAAPVNRDAPINPVQPVDNLVKKSAPTVLIVKDYQRFFDNLELVRMMKNSFPAMKAKKLHVVMVAPTTNLPIEWEMETAVTDFPLPTEGEIRIVAEAIIKDNNFRDEDGKHLTVSDETIRAAVGLTLAEAESAIARSLSTMTIVDRKLLEDEKLKAIRKGGILEVFPPMKEEDLGGMGELKAYLHRRKVGFHDISKPPLKGLLMVGPPGSGKSLAAKVVASIFDYPLVRFDLSALKGSLVGETERKTREALMLIDAISPCILWIDEIEKGLGGVQSSGRTDGGTTSNMFGYLLTWMQESKARKYIVATSNDLDELLALSHGALIRRFDDVFFVDLPSAPERKEILSIQCRKYNQNIKINGLVDQMEGWSGAEVEKFVIASAYDGEEEALRQMLPLSKINPERLARLREWGGKFARKANTIEQSVTEGEGSRKVERTVQ